MDENNIPKHTRGVTLREPKDVRRVIQRHHGGSGVWWWGLQFRRAGQGSILTQFKFIQLLCTSFSERTPIISAQGRLKAYLRWGLHSWLIHISLKKRSLEARNVHMFVICEVRLLCDIRQIDDNRMMRYILGRYTTENDDFALRMT
jgi:hypothetical protein